MVKRNSKYLNQQPAQNLVLFICSRLKHAVLRATLIDLWYGLDLSMTNVSDELLRRKELKHFQKI